MTTKFLPLLSETEEARGLPAVNNIKREVHSSAPTRSTIISRQPTFPGQDWKEGALLVGIQIGLPIE